MEGDEFADKEQWEPLIDSLLCSPARSLIESVWAVDWQNHGQSAVLDQDVLEHRDPVGKSYRSSRMQTICGILTIKLIGIEDYGDLLREF